ncbi:MAG: branched-chain amino acid ABC transporter permease [Chloroflexi bacterium]|nr:MAG: branched-chain amino acid ABC transporter permease [Chloroflexota bacterium]
MAQAIASGILTGGLYGIIAIGITLNWGMMRVINLAHFSFSFLAAYFTYQITVDTGIDPFLTLFVTIPLFFIFGVALQWFFETFEIEDFMSLLVTFGMFLIFESIMRERWTADFRTLSSTEVAYKTEALRVLGLSLTVTRLAVFLVAIAISLGIWIFLNRTYAGKALRAISQDRAIASAYGVNHRQMALLLGGIAGASAAIAGAFIAVIFVLRPDGATDLIGFIFAVVILGGLGNTAGAFMAGIFIGVVQNVTGFTSLGPGFAPLITFLVLIFGLLLRPEGLFTGIDTWLAKMLSGRQT